MENIMGYEKLNWFLVAEVEQGCYLEFLGTSADSSFKNIGVKSLLGPQLNTGGLHSLSAEPP